MLIGNINLSSDTVKFILTNVKPDPTLHTYSDIAGTELPTGGGYTAGGLPTTITLSNNQGTEIVTATDVTFDAAGGMGPFRYVVAYDSTPAVQTLICWFDFQSELTIATGDQFIVEPSSSSPAGTLFALG